MERKKTLETMLIYDIYVTTEIISYQYNLY